MILAAVALLCTAPCQEPGPRPADPQAVGEARPVVLTLQLLRGSSQVPLTADAPVFLGETLTARLDLRIDEDHRADQMVPRFRRPLDLELELATPWLDGGMGYRLLDAMPLSGGTTSLVVDREPARLSAPTESTGGAYRLERRIVITEATWSLQPAVARWTSAESFTEDLVRGRIAVDPQEQEIRSAAWSGTARELPAASVVGFAGAVGDFHTRFRAEPPQADGLVVLTWTFRGFGALPPENLPQFSNLEGAQVVAQRTGSTADALQLHLELRPLPGSDAFQLPSWITFDPLAEDFQVHAFPVTPWDTLDPAREVVATISSLPTAAASPGPVAPQGTPPADGPVPRTGLPETQLPDFLIPVLLGSSLLIGVILLLVAKREPKDLETQTPPDSRQKFQKTRPAQFSETSGAGHAQPADPIAKAIVKMAEDLDWEMDCFYRDDLSTRLLAKGYAQKDVTRISAFFENLRRWKFGNVGTAPSRKALNEVREILFKGQA